MYGSHTWTYEELDVMNETDSDATAVDVSFVLVCTDPGAPPSGMSGPPEFYDPGEAATWEIESIEIILDQAPPIKVTEAQLGELFPNGNDMITNAIEHAAENGVLE